MTHSTAKMADHITPAQRTGRRTNYHAVLWMPLVLAALVAGMALRSYLAQGSSGVEAPDRKAAPFSVPCRTPRIGESLTVKITPRADHLPADVHCRIRPVL